MFKKSLPLALALAAGLASTSAVQAQWERAYGVKDQIDEGHRRATPVAQCPGGGYIAIGTRDLAGLPQVYVIRTDDFGGTIWEQYYDVGNDGRPDEGFSLTEVRGGGWVTVGTSQRGNRWEAHSLKLNCDGKPLFSYFYVAPNVPPLSYYRFVAHDVREAFSGDGITTNAGDLLVAGYIEGASLNTADAVLLRLDRGGNLIWHRRYDTGGYDERFFGLTEARPTWSPAGEIVAVGEWAKTGHSQGLVARVDGNTGAVGLSSDQCVATYGENGQENFQSVVEVETWPETGSLVMAGLSTSPGMYDDVYIVRTKPNPCGLSAQVTIGNETGDKYNEHATDIVEVLAPVDPGLGVPVGSFALTGSAETKYSVADAFLLFVKPTSHYPIAARRYGDHRDWVDFGSSLAQNPPFGPQAPGFVISGTTTTDWDGSADPSDLYLIQTTDSGKTGCEKEWFPDGADWPWPVSIFTPTFPKFARQVQVLTKDFQENTAAKACN